MSATASLKFRAVRRFVITLAFMIALLFLPAGSVRFWQAWLLVGVMAIPSAFFFLNLLKHNPQLLERRLQAQETQPEQKVFQRLFSTTLFPALMVAGLDFRFGWSRTLGSVPIAVVLIAQGLVALGYYLIFRVMKANTFAASVIRVESHQA